jgi:CRISPR-associated endonuclease Cas1
MDALRWLRAQDAALLVLDVVDGRLVFSSTVPGSDDARLRRSQAMAATTPIGLRIASTLLAAKLEGQARLAGDTLNRPDAAETIETLAAALSEVSTIEEARQLEATAANAYWSAWSDNPATAMRFAGREQHRVPEHWFRFDSRRSLLSGGKSNRKAERPLNAVLNYLYALAQIETRVACLAVGLDPGLGVVHADTRNRDSMVLDVLEPVRAAVEETVLGLAVQRVWRKADFHERPDGSVMLGLEVRHTLPRTMELWAKTAAPVAELVAHRLGETVEGVWKPTAPLTRAKRRQAAAKVKARKAAVASATASKQAGRRPVPVVPQLFRTCVDCGGPLTGPSGRPSRQVRCESCWDAAPGQGSSQRRQRGRSIAASRAETEAWRAEHRGQQARPEDFAPIRAGLAKVRLVEIMLAAGVAKSTASMIRSRPLAGVAFSADQ